MRELMGYSILFCLWAILFSATVLALVSMAASIKSAWKRFRE